MTPDRGGRCATGACDTGYRYRRPERGATSLTGGDHARVL